MVHLPPTTTIQVPAHTIEEVWIESSGEYQVILAAAGARAEIKGAFSVANKDTVEVKLLIVHQAPHTSAQTILKGVARDQSRVSFTGRIKIEPGCGDVQSFLEERILLLSDQAKAEAIPELEILADDVKCSHAASISRIPAEHLFYLQSRGIPQAQAEQLIAEGFLEI
jgi:Fe-S cluster assembly protein SufD